jgi:hypothetical protein
VDLELAPQQIGRYRILERLGAGGMGAVYRAHDPQLDRVVAIKVPLFDVPLSQLAQRIQRFEREARSAAQVWHPHVCPIYDVGEHDGQPYVVMAYVEGHPLSARLARGRFEDPTEAVTLTLQLLDALDAVHARGIVHRDLKPGNVMLDAAGRAILMDFGLARPEQQSAEQLTSDGVVLGTPSYMAPEQAAGQAEQIGPWTDLYSLGVVLYQMLTGRLPFEGPPLTVLARIVHETPPPPRSLRPDLDPGLEALLLRALARECTARYQNTGEFADALRWWQRGAAAAATLPVGAAVRPLPAAQSPVPVTMGGLRGSPAARRRLDFWFDITLGMVAFVAGFAFLYAVTANYFQWGSTAGAFILLAGAVLGLVVRGARRGWPDPQGALLRAAEQGRLERVKRLIRAGVDLAARDEMGETALMKAAHKGHADCVKVLIVNGADVNARAPFGESVLSVALREGHTAIAELLRQAGASE